MATYASLPASSLRPRDKVFPLILLYDCKRKKELDKKKKKRKKRLVNRKHMSLQEVGKGTAFELAPWITVLSYLSLCRPKNLLGGYGFQIKGRFS